MASATSRSEKRRLSTAIEKCIPAKKTKKKPRPLLYLRTWPAPSSHAPSSRSASAQGLCSAGTRCGHLRAHGCSRASAGAHACSDPSSTPLVLPVCFPPFSKQPPPRIPNVIGHDKNEQPKGAKPDNRVDEPRDGDDHCFNCFHFHVSNFVLSPNTRSIILT